MPRNSQSPPMAVETTSSLSVGCAPQSSRIGDGTLHDRVAQGAETLDLDLDDVAGVDRAGEGRRAGEQDVAGHERDGAGDVGDEVVHVPLHLGRRRVLLDDAVDAGLDALVAEVPAGDQAGADGRERVGALDAEHRAGVGVAEVVQAVVVADGVARDVVACLLRGDVAAGASDDDDDLALVVEPLAALRPHHGALVRVQGGDGLVEVGRGRRELRHELLRARVVVQVDRDDLGRLDRRQVDRVVDAHRPSVGGDELVAVPDGLDRGTLEEDASVLGHAAAPLRVHPVSGRSNQTCTWLVPMEFS